MVRASKHVAWLSLLLATALVTRAPHAAAQACQSARPSDPQGAAGLSYGNVELGFLDAPSGRARVHYALSGPHAPPTASTMQQDLPDAVVVAAEAADDALNGYAALGYLPPLGDGDSPCRSNGDSDVVDIYLVNFSAADGQAVVDHCEGDGPRRCGGFVLVENDFGQGGYADTAEGMRTVVPHELFHLVQSAYDADIKPWWAEGSAQWAAKQIYPTLGDLERFLPAYFATPSQPLNVPPGGVATSLLYATAIWPVFLSERFEPEIMHEVFEALGQGAGEILPATDGVLGTRGSSLAEAFLQFAAYNAATGKRAGTSGYRDAASYPLVPVTALEATSGDLVSEVGSGLGAYYYSLETTEPTELLLDADPTRVAALLVPELDGKLQLAQAQPLPATLEGAGVVVVAGQSLARTDAPFTLTGKALGNSAGASTVGDAAAPESSGCALGGPGRPTAFSGVGLGFVVILLRRGRAKRSRKGR